jgi:CubicO group peptidase (beta-lactamase class C family)
MARLGEAILASFNGRGILKKASIELMCQNHTVGKGDNRGLGWMIKGPASLPGDFFSDRSFGHTGFTGTSLWIDPVRKIYAVLLSNRVHPSRESMGIIRTRQIFHNLVAMEYGE